jgi:ABC-type glycerol-3-phosphate transport system substrate-binding protein
MTRTGRPFSRRSLLSWSLAASGAAVLGGCTGTPGQGGGDTKNATIRLTHWWGNQFGLYTDMMEQKTGIALQDQGTAGAGYNEKLLTQLVSGTAPDLFLLDAPNNPNFFSRGVVAPFDDYLASRDDVDDAKWNIAPKTETGFQGKIMGLSIFTSQDVIMHVNRELAAKDGLGKDLPLWGKPTFDQWKWPEFVEWLKAATKRTSNGRVEQYGLGATGDLSYVARALVASNGGKIFDDEWNGNEQACLIDQDPVVEAVQEVIDLVRKHNVAPSPATEQSIQGGMYRAGRAVCTPTWASASILAEQDLFPQDHFHLPYVRQRVHTVGANALCVNKTSKNADAAMEWAVTFCVDEEVRKKFLQYSSVPAYDPLPIVEGSPDSTAKRIALVGLSRIKGMSTLPKNTEGVVNYPRWYGSRVPGIAGEAFGDAFESAMIGKQSVADALRDAKERIDNELAKAS